MNGAALAVHQFRFDQRTFWRNPAAVFFTVAFPVMFLVIFDLVFGGDEAIEGLGVDVSTYYVPAIVSLAVISATFQNLAMSVTIDREFGILKRGRGTPLPNWVFFAGRIGTSLVVSFLMLALLAAIGRIAYGVAIPWDRMPAVIVTLAVGAMSFCCLGLALTAFIPSQGAAAPITNIAIFPLYFLSGAPFLRGVLRRLGAWDRGRRLRVGAPGRARGVGRRRVPDRDALVPVDAARRIGTRDQSASVWSALRPAGVPDPPVAIGLTSR
jgi:ABC-2 type transport system permease protein